MYFGLHVKECIIICMNISEIREDFPQLKRKISGESIIYFDNAATSLRPKSVVDAITDFYFNYNANVHRGIHVLSKEATDAYEKAHKDVASFIGASSVEEIIFTRNTTESINLVAFTLYLSGRLKEGDGVVISLMEHHSNMVPWQFLRDNFHIKLFVVRLKEDGSLDMNHLEDILSKEPNIKVVSITHASNVLGIVNDVKEISRLAHEYGAIFVVDGAQAAPHIGINVKDIDCDFYAFSGHKMLGPTGIGALYGRVELLSELEPFLRGGDMIWRVTIDKVTFNKLPWKYEAGTPNIAGGIGFGYAVNYLRKIGMENVEKYEHDLALYAISKMEELDFVKIYGPKKRIGVIAFNIMQKTKLPLSPDVVASILNKYGIAIRSGCHCAQPLHNDFLGVRGTARASFYIYNTKEEIDKFVDILRNIKNAL